MRDDRRVLYWVAGSLFLVLIWSIASRAVGASIILPGPAESIKELFASFSSAPFYRHLVNTLARAVGGFLAAYLIGIAWGLSSGLSPHIGALLRPALQVMRATPVIAVILLALIWFNAQFAPLFVTVLMVLPVVTENIAAGVRASAPRLLEMAQVFAVPGSRIVRSIVVPALAPALSSSAHAGLGMAFKVTVAAEVLVQPVWALGGQMQEARFFLDTPRILALTVTVVFLSALTDALLRFVETLAAKKDEQSGLQVSAGPAEPRSYPSAVASGDERQFSPVPLLIEHLSVRWGLLEVIDDLSMSAGPGTVTVIFGPSGCGKSTLLHSICGLVEADAGVIEPSSPGLASIAFQEPRLLPRGTAVDNVEFANTGFQGSPERLLATCGLDGWQEVDTRVFSGGMQQRVSLARAFSVGRPLLLLDEPLGSLDLATTMKLALEIRSITGQEHRTTVVVTHDVTEALLLADTVLILSPRPGRVVAEQSVSLSAADRDPRGRAFQHVASELYSTLLLHSHA